MYLARQPHRDQPSIRGSPDNACFRGSVRRRARRWCRLLAGRAWNSGAVDLSISHCRLVVHAACPEVPAEQRRSPPRDGKPGRPRANNASQRRHARGPKEGASPPLPVDGTPNPVSRPSGCPLPLAPRCSAPAVRGSSKTGPGPMHADSQTLQALIATLQRRTRTRRENAKPDQPMKMGCTLVARTC